MLRAVGFDLDGTLFDDRQYVRAGLERAAKELESVAGVDLSEEFREAYFDRGIREGTFDVVLEEHDVPQRFVPTLVEAYHDNDADLTPYPGADRILDDLAESYALGLVTGGHNGTDKLDRLGLSEYFDAVVVTSDAEYSKHEPDPYLRVLRSLDVSPEETVYVGDRPELDFRQPNRLGMYTVRVQTGQYAAQDTTDDTRPNAVVPALEDLPVLLEELD